MFGIPYPKKILFALVLVFIFCSSFAALWSLVGSHTLGWDEAVYLTKARSWAEGTPADEFRPYRPIAMPAFGWIFLHFGDTEEILRLFGALFGAVTLVFLFLLFRSITNSWVALSIVYSVGTSSLFLQQAPQFLNDIPSSGLLFGILWLIWKYYKTAGESKSILLAAPLAALAFYLRYGVVLSLGFIGIVSLLLLLRKFAGKGDTNFSVLAKTFAVFAAFMLPHGIHSFIVEGSVLGILRSGSTAGGREYLGEGLLDYIQWLPSALAGPLVGASTILGIAVTLAIIFRRNLRQNYEGLLWLRSTGVFNFFFTGLLVHAEARYVFFPVALLSGVGIAGVYFLLKKVRLQVVGIGLFALATLLFGVFNYQEAATIVKEKETDISRNEYRETYKAILQNKPKEEKCVVWSIDYLPQISWYTQCNTLRIAETKNIVVFPNDPLVTPKGAHYNVVFAKSENGQIQPDNAERYGAFLTQIHRSREFPLFIGRGQATVYRMQPKKSPVRQITP